MKKLIGILSYNRRHGSEGEFTIIHKYITPLNPQVFQNKLGEDMAYVVEVRPEESTILWSCHTDTVHGANDPLRTLPQYDPKTRMVSSGGNVILGADDGAGMWLLLEMIEAGIAGTYIFHRGEECGGIGSSYMAQQHGDWLARFTHAIAFDRKGTTSVITAQWGVCCSDNFARHFADHIKQVSKGELLLKPDDTGVFTDTANYTDIISECTNISVGYYNAHTTKETLDVNYLKVLRDAMCATTTHTFPVFERPQEVWGATDKWGWMDAPAKHAGGGDLYDDVQDWLDLNGLRGDDAVGIEAALMTYPHELAGIITQHFS